MFWKKSEPAPASSGVSPSGNPSAPPNAAKELDSALDTVVAMMRAFGEHAFDTDNVDARHTRDESDGWARKLSMGERRLDGETTSIKRDWGGVRRYFVAHRAHEREYVTASVTNLREAVHAFARCLTRTVGEDRTADKRVGAQLGNLVAAFRDNDADVIRREAEAVVRVVSEVMDQRRNLQQQQVKLLGEKIARLKSELQAARDSAALDPLTQLHNRSSLDAHLERVADLSFLMSATPCLLMIDVDHFKSINDRFGHPVGDEVIRKVADTLVRNFLRREDFVARYGGEEFVVVVPDSSPSAVQARAERVRSAVAELVFKKAEQEFAVTTSIGMAVLTAGDTGPTWLARADAALYEAKGAGRNRVVLAQETASAVGKVLVTQPSSPAPAGPRSPSRPPSKAAAEK